MVVAAVVGGVATVGSAVASSSAASKASKTAKNTAAANNALQQDIYNQNKATLSPYVEEGNKATGALGDLLGLNGAGSQNAGFGNYLNSTGYQFQLGQGEKAVTAALGSKGLLDSGAAQKALTNYGQQQALTGFGNYANLLAGQQGVGLSAASAQAGAGAGYANSVSANNNVASEASQNAALAGAAGINSALGSALGAYGLSQGLGSSYAAPTIRNPSVDLSNIKMPAFGV
jgi:type II secretory pathway pseudopilin PulG